MKQREILSKSKDGVRRIAVPFERIGPDGKKECLYLGIGLGFILTEKQAQAFVNCRTNLRGRRK